MKTKFVAAVLALAVVASVIAQSFPRASNLSTRMRLPAGEILTVGFVVVDGPKTFLIRAVGPGLTQLGVTGAIDDPQLGIFRGNTLIRSNDNWGETVGATLPADTTAARVGAFPLPNGSRDAALAIGLEPGAYTVQARSTNNQAGEVLIEIYEVPATN